MLQCRDASRSTAKLLRTNSIPRLLFVPDCANAMNDRRRSTSAASSEKNILETSGETASKIWNVLTFGLKETEDGHIPFKKVSKQSTKPTAVEISVPASIDVLILSAPVKVRARSCTP